MIRDNHRGQTPFKAIGLIALVGLVTSTVSFLRFKSPGDIDPVVIFLLLAYPLLIGVSVYLYLQNKKNSAALQEEYFIKWYLQSFAKTCLTENDLQVIREELVNSMLRLIRPALVNIYEIDPQTNRLEVVCQAGIKNPPDDSTQGYPFGEGIPGWVMQNQNAVILADISREQYLKIDPWARALDLRSYAAVPIIAGEKAIGIVAMYSLEPNFFQDSNLLIAQLAAHLYGLNLAKTYNA